MLVCRQRDGGVPDLEPIPVGIAEHNALVLEWTQATELAHDAGDRVVNLLSALLPSSSSLALAGVLPVRCVHRITPSELAHGLPAVASGHLVRIDLLERP